MPRRGRQQKQRAVKTIRTRAAALQRLFIVISVRLWLPDGEWLLFTLCLVPLLWTPQS